MNPKYCQSPTNIHATKTFRLRSCSVYRIEQLCRTEGISKTCRWGVTVLLGSKDQCGCLGYQTYELVAQKIRFLFCYAYGLRHDIIRVTIIALAHRALLAQLERRERKVRKWKEIPGVHMKRYFVKSTVSIARKLQDFLQAWPRAI